MYVEMKKVNKTFNEYRASDDVSFQIEKGKLIALLGPSGSGKTTILRMIAGLEYPDSGDIFIDGVLVNGIPASKRGIGFVFQNYALFRYMTVFDNIAFGLDLKKEKKSVIKERVLYLIKLVGLEGLEKRYPHQLSGGQKQRVAFARALAPNPQILLLDEPFAAIDAKVRQELRSWLRGMIDQLGITSIFVTHDQDEAIEVADEIIVTNRGRVEQMGTPIQIYKNPASSFVAQFIGQSSVIDDYQLLNGFAKVRDLTQAVVRPEFIKVSKQNESLQYESATEKGVIEEISFRGNNLELKVRVGHTALTAFRSLEKEEVKVGETVNVLIYRVYVFNDEKAVLLENSKMVDPNPIYI